MDRLSPVEPSLKPAEFVREWRPMALKERSASQPHFIDLCRMLGWPSPTDVDKKGEFYTFERPAARLGAGPGWADVWLKGHFGWEYKGPGKSLVEAYSQLQRYQHSLENPPLLIVSDLSVIEVHSNFNNTPKRVEVFTLDDLLEPERRELLRCIFYRPEAFKAEITTEEVTKEAARRFAALADRLRARGVEAPRAAHFLIRLLFCLFAEDVGLLPKDLFASLVQAGRQNAERFNRQIRDLFAAMSEKDSYFGASAIKYFNGGLFDSAEAVDLDRDDLDVLARIAGLDWASIEPSIFGTLFERSLDPSKRSQLGAHYTSREDILLIVEPVLMAPLRRQWAEQQAAAGELVTKRDAAAGSQRTKLDGQLREQLLGFMQTLAHHRVLDPACGSGNFLYVSLKAMSDLWKEVWVYMGQAGITPPMALDNLAPSPAQLYGIELNEYAHELAQVTVWIGYIQWLRDNGFGFPSEPILRKIDTIRQMDAVLTFGNDGEPIEPAWPAAEVIIGNPPFLGGNRIRQGLGDGYVEGLFDLYSGRVPALADLSCYWFERARARIEEGATRRAGLLATQGIRGGANRRVLDRVKDTGDIFWAQADRDWILDGATVHVSMVGFDDGSETSRWLDNVPVPAINSDLSVGSDLSLARPLPENRNLCFRSDEKGGPFDIDNETARAMLMAIGNPNGRPNSDVIRPYFNGRDIVQRPRGAWVIDFGCDASYGDASMYEAPFEYVRAKVKPVRDAVRSERERTQWWIHRRPAPDMRQATFELARFIVTPAVSKHRLFVWLLGNNTIPDHQLYVIAREDDYMFGVLHSTPHELWARRAGTQLREAESGARYTPTTCFDTFPFPWPPGQEPSDHPTFQDVSKAARELVEMRERRLNPEGASDAELKKRTLTNLYNERPSWLAMAHQRLDAAVFAAYGWPEMAGELADEVILERLLALNLERASK